MRRMCMLAIGLAAAAASAQELSPREIFYGQGRPAAAAAARTDAPKPRRTADASKPPVPAKPKPEETASTNPPVSQPSHDSTPRANEAQRVKTVAVAETIRPLGLKYFIMKRTDAGEYVQAEPDASFVNGDQIRLIIETNDTGYLYVVAQGTSKMWKPLFPSPEISGGDNKVERGKRYNIPNDSVFSFSGAPGTEKLFIVLSRQPEGDIRSMMYKLEDRQRQNAAPSDTLLAANIGIQDSVIQRLRSSYARDLVIEKVDDTKTPARKAPPAEAVQAPERAVYVVNARAGEKAWVVADIDLRHE